MQRKKRLLSLLLTVLMLCTMSLTAHAYHALDVSKKGSISATIQYDNKAIPGGTLTLYRVGTISKDGDGYTFTSDFSGSKESLTDISSASLAKRLMEYAEKQKLSGITKDIDNNGKVTFSDLELGLYLLVQNKAASGYNLIAPFLVTIPMLENGTYVYDVNASPKLEIQKTPTTPTTTNPTKTPTTTTTKKTTSTLPKTGQLNWPIPVLVVSGLGLFSVGWMLRYGKKRNSYEK